MNFKTYPAALLPDWKVLGIFRKLNNGFVALMEQSAIVKAPGPSVVVLLGQVPHVVELTCVQNSMRKFEVLDRNACEKPERASNAI